MILSRREKYIVVTTFFAVAALLVDAYGLTPLLKARNALAAKRQELQAKIDQHETLIDRKAAVETKWREMLASGLEAGRVGAESRMLHALRDWASDSRLNLASLKPQQPKERDGLLEISLQASATGRMDAVARFLWRIETASLPVRISQLQLGARKEGQDDLSLQLTVSALCVPDGQIAPPVAPSRRNES